MRLHRLVFAKEVPIWAKSEVGFNEYAVLVCGEICATHYLPNEKHFGLEVSSHPILSTLLICCLEVVESALVVEF